jgi:geranylgeranyl pyrophosphate synthase
MAVPAFFAEYQRAADAELRRLLADADDAVQRSMAYTVLAPSKRVRPVLTLLCAELCGGKTSRAVPVACAVELVHAASLILDDLPSMDDAPLRRGRWSPSAVGRTGSGSFRRSCRGAACRAADCGRPRSARIPAGRGWARISLDT